MTPKGAPTLSPLGEYEGRKDLALSRTVSIIGSREGARIRLASRTVSKAHALIVNQNSGPYIRDLTSRTRTQLNGQSTIESELRDGDRITIGRYRLRFNAGRPPIRDGAALGARPRRYDPPPPAVLRVQGVDLPVPIVGRSLTIGRRAGTDVRLLEQSVSSVHAVIFEFNGRHVLRDLGSRTGTKVKGHTVGQIELRPGDQITIGETSLSYEPAAAVPEQPSAQPMGEPLVAAAAKPDDDLDELDRRLGLPPIAESTDSAEGSASQSAEAGELPGDSAAGMKGVAAIDQELEIRGFESEPELERLGGDDDRVALEGDAPGSDDTHELPALTDAPRVKPVMRLRHEPERVEEVSVSPTASMEDTIEDEKMQSRGGWRAITLSAGADAPATPADEQAPAPPVAEPVAGEEPVAAEEPVAVEEPVAAEEPAAAAEPGAVPEQALQAEPDAPAELIELDAPTPAIEAPPEPVADAPAAELALEPVAEQVESEIPDPLQPEMIVPEPVPDDPADIEPPQTEEVLDLPDAEPTETAVQVPPPLDLSDEAAADELTQGEADLDPLVLAEQPEEPAADVHGESDGSGNEPPVELDAVPPVEIEPPATAQGRPRRSRGPRKARTSVARRPPPQGESQAAADAPVDPLAAIDLPPVSLDLVEPPPLEPLAEDDAPEAVVESPPEPETPAPMAVVKQAEPVVPSLLEVAPDDPPIALPGEAPLTDDDLAAEMEQFAGASTGALIESEQAESIDGSITAQTTGVSEQEQTAALEAESHDAVAENELDEPLPPLTLEEPPPLDAPQTPQEEPAAAEAPLLMSGWGANQDHFLGGMALPLPPSPAAAQDAAPPRPAPGGARKLRIVFDGDSGPPIAGSAAPAAPVQQVKTTGFEGLSFAPLREAAPLAVGPEPMLADEEPAASGLSDDTDTPGHGSVLRSDAAEPSDGSPSDTFADMPIRPSAQERARDAEQAQLVIAIPDATEPMGDGDGVDLRAAPRRRRMSLPMLVVLMVILAALAAAAVYLFVPIHGRVEATLRFSGAASLTQLQRQQMRQEQRDLLTAPQARDAAALVLADVHRGVSGGFLVDQAAYRQVAESADWKEPSGATADLLLVRDGSIAGGDDRRLHSLLLALYRANAPRLASEELLRGEVEAADVAHRRSQEQLALVRQRIEHMQSGAGHRPDETERASLRDELARAEKALGDSVMEIKTLQADLEQLHKGMPVELQPTTAGMVAVVDPRLVELDNDLAKLNQRLTAVRISRAQEAEQAKADLAEQMQGVEQQASAVEEATKASEDQAVQEYSAAAGRLGASVRRQIEQLIQRQQDQQAELSASQQRLAGQVEAFRARQWEKDPQLKQFGEQLQSTQRQHDQAVKDGRFSEAEDLTTAAALLQQMIKARQTLVAEDPSYAAAIDELEKLIDTQRQQMEADRQQAEQALQDLSRSMAGSQRTAQRTLSEPQREQAAALADRLDRLAVAMKDYVRAADAGASDDPDAAAMQQELETIQDQIDQRRASLAEEQRKAAAEQQERTRQQRIVEREEQLAQARKRETEAQQTWSEAFRRNQDAQAALATAREVSEQGDDLSRQRTELEAQVAQEARTLQAKREQLAALVVPVAPTLEGNVRVVGYADRRPAYAGSIAGAIVITFSVLILMAARSQATPGPTLAGRTMPRPIPRPADEAPPEG
jgi:pSer/pThr/pTyr-binding forkhead associated (FHA) protein